MFLNVRTDPRRFHSLFPCFDHVTLGGGLPVALHDSVTLSVSSTVWLPDITVMLGGTKEKLIDEKNE